MSAEECKSATPALRRYAARVTSADQGAVLKTPEYLQRNERMFSGENDTFRIKAL